MADKANHDPMELLAALSGETTSNTFDSFRSQADPTVLIFVPSQSVPPFRFKAGGWEVSQSAIDLGPAMKIRISENGFFMCRLVEGGTGWIELSDLSPVGRSDAK